MVSNETDDCEVVFEDVSFVVIVVFDEFIVVLTVVVVIVLELEIIGSVLFCMFEVILVLLTFNIGVVVFNKSDFID